MGIIKLEHGEHGEEYALELDGGQLLVIIRFVEPDGMDVTYPPGQLEKWERLAEREGKSVEDVVEAALDVAFSELDGGDK